MKDLNILFLGASKRVSLLERFINSSADLGVPINIFSCEKEDGFYPISRIARILKGPSFLQAEFIPWLENRVEVHDINLVIPNLDSATLALSRYANIHPRTTQFWPVVSSEFLCTAMFDKRRSHSFFSDAGLPLPVDTPGKFPKIAKPRFGSGGRGIQILKSIGEWEALVAASSRDEYLIEDFLTSVKETTVDIYVSPQKGLVGYVLRDRLEVSDGEVMVCKTRVPEKNERELIERVARLPGWVGCITLQYMTDAQGQCYVVEINPRFGGGCTCAIEAGLNMPKYLISEALERDFDHPAYLRNIHMTRARRDFFCEF